VSLDCVIYCAFYSILLGEGGAFLSGHGVQTVKHVQNSQNTTGIKSTPDDDVTSQLTWFRRRCRVFSRCLDNRVEVYNMTHTRSWHFSHSSWLYSGAWGSDARCQRVWQVVWCLARYPWAWFNHGHLVDSTVLILDVHGSAGVVRCNTAADADQVRPYVYGIPE